MKQFPKSASNLFAWSGLLLRFVEVYENFSRKLTPIFDGGSRLEITVLGEVSI
jgi:hypothetical protein